MRITFAAVLACIAGAAVALDPSWSFAFTTTITDEAMPWYTIKVPFLTTVTTHLSGTVETITATKVSISIGTESPSTIQPACTDTISGTVVPCGGWVARSPLTVDGGENEEMEDGEEVERGDARIEVRLAKR
ncbi:hypothetical protein GGS24DRAFT_502596 [Hypoxylon argillaceum]|nr:hypothetical protein GGS24DRAFT_502596 [Hypoxylon argillaceum]